MHDKITLRDALENPIWLMVYLSEPNKKIDVTMSYIELKAIYDMVNAKKGELADKPHWISVEERLPEHLTSVIVHRKDGGIFVWEFFNTSPTDECWMDDSMNVYSFYDVTHWMPLPEPPKGEDDVSGQT